MPRQLYQPALLALGLVFLVLPRTALSQCASFDNARVALNLVTPPYAGIPSVLQVSDLYTSGATIGTVQATVTGTRIEVFQINHVSPTLPSITCRVQYLDIGMLPPGDYDVTWTTTENITIPLPMTRSRVRTLRFTILPAAAIPAASDQFLILLALTLAGVGALRGSS